MSDETQEWMMSVIEGEGGKRIYRVRQEAPAGVLPAEYANIIVIEWLFEGQMPDKKTNRAQMQFETLMDPLDENGNSLLMLVCTAPGFKEWCYYARDYDTFMMDLNQALQGQPRFPIDITHNKDNTWKYWTGLKDFAKGT